MLLVPVLWPLSKSYGAPRLDVVCELLREFRKVQSMSQGSLFLWKVTGRSFSGPKSWVVWESEGITRMRQMVLARMIETQIWCYLCLQDKGSAKEQWLLSVLLSERKPPHPASALKPDNLFPPLMSLSLVPFELLPST